MHDQPEASPPSASLAGEYAHPFDRIRTCVEIAVGARSAAIDDELGAERVHDTAADRAGLTRHDARALLKLVLGVEPSL